MQLYPFHSVNTHIFTLKTKGIMNKIDIRYLYWCSASAMDRRRQFRRTLSKLLSCWSGRMWCDGWLVLIESMKLSKLPFGISFGGNPSYGTVGRSVGRTCKRKRHSNGALSGVWSQLHSMKIAPHTISIFHHLPKPCWIHFHVAAEFTKRENFKCRTMNTSSTDFTSFSLNFKQLVVWSSNSEQPNGLEHHGHVKNAPGCTLKQCMRNKKIEDKSCLHIEQTKSIF